MPVMYMESHLLAPVRMGREDCMSISGRWVLFQLKEQC